MQISYRREMKHNYLIIDPEEITWRNYECKMLSENTISGILQFQLRQVDDEIRFYYEITSRQPLSRILENHLLRESEIRQIILGISGVLDRMEQYLLRENSVLLEPDYIYVNPEDFQIWLCLVPGVERDFPYDYGKLLEYLLGKINHQDKESVILAYGLYQETRKENYGMEDILRLLGSEKRGQNEQIKKEYEEKWTEEREASRRYDFQQTEHWKTESADEIKTEEKRDARCGEWQRENKKLSRKSKRNAQKKIQSKTQETEQWGIKQNSINARHKNCEANETVNPAKKSGIWTRIKECWKKWRHKSKSSAYNPDDAVWESLFRDELSEERTGFAEEREEAFFDRKGLSDFDRKELSDIAIAQGRNTTLLADLSLKEDSNSRRLCALDSGMEDIEISYYPFVIGKQEHLADYCLNHETVSRLHVRIDEIDGGWQIQDLNSSNGTMVAGRLLENNEAVLLHLNDEVKIADLRYRFV